MSLAAFRPSAIVARRAVEIGQKSSWPFSREGSRGSICLFLNMRLSMKDTEEETMRKEREEWQQRHTIYGRWG